MGRLYNANAIAEYVISYSTELENPVSNLKLQKLLYYIQASFLVEKNTPCFKEAIEHWRHGPVIREVYSKYKINFNDKIINKYNNENINDSDKELIKKVIDSYKTYSPWDMVSKTHNEEPWVNTNSDDIITIEELEKYYKKNNDKIYG